MENGGWLQHTLQGWVQTLLLHSHRQFFHVFMDSSAEEQPPPSVPQQPVCIDQQRVDEILAHLPVWGHGPADAEEQQTNVRDVPVWLISTGILDFVAQSTSAGLPPQELAQLLPTAIAQTSPLTLVTQKWLIELTIPLGKQSVLLRCKIVSPDP